MKSVADQAADGRRTDDPPDRAGGAEFFANSQEHLLAELERIDLLIGAEVANLRKIQATDENFRGLYISEQDVDALLARPLGHPRWFTYEAVRPRDLEARLEIVSDGIESRKQASLQRGLELRLESFRRMFELEPFEVDAFLICMAMEIDLRYERLYAYLQDDVTRKRPSVDLILSLLTTSPARRLDNRRYFLSDARLCRRSLIDLVEDTSQPHQPLLSRYVKPDDRVVHYLLGSDVPDIRLRRWVELVPARGSLDDLIVADELLRGLRACAVGVAGAAGAVIYLTGPAGIGKRRIARALCAERGRKLLVADVDRLLAEPLNAFAANLALIEREAQLQGAAVLWKGIDALRAEPNQQALGVFRELLNAGTDLCFLSGRGRWDGPGPVCERRHTLVDLPQPDYAQRVQMWRGVLQKNSGPALGQTAVPVDAASVAARFKLTFGQIEDAAGAAEDLARWRGAGAVTDADLYHACRANSNRKLSTLARKITPHHKWSDIVLPPDRLGQLREICNHVKYRDQVYGDWGFGRKRALGKGLSVLFAGPSGTGKTMAAGIIASELALDLYKIDLSSVISKYIGETEKNLARIFDEAETSNAILFFDEADALFGKRSEVHDSHDRYANIEVGYLLQRMEEYEGVAILATNFRKNMDEAFVRRLHFTVDFPFPDQDDRSRIWHAIWPESTPRDKHLDLEFLARRFQITGGNICNVALTAAFLAADDGGIVHMGHVILATQREYQKMGKLTADAEFTGYIGSGSAQ